MASDVLRFLFQADAAHTQHHETETLVSRSLRGETAAFAALHERYARMVHAVLLARTAPEDARDLVQEVFLIAWQRLSELQDKDAFGPWIVRIARNRATDLHRAKRSSVELPADLAAPERPTAEANEALAAICALPEAYRETLLMRLVEGLTGPEIAQRTGMTHGSVRVNLTRGMKLLKAQLEGEHG